MIVYLTVFAVWGGTALLLYLCDYLKAPKVEVSFKQVFDLLPCSEEHIIETLTKDAREPLLDMERLDMIAVYQGYVTITSIGERVKGKI